MWSFQLGTGFLIKSEIFSFNFCLIYFSLSGIKLSQVAEFISRLIPLICDISENRDEKKLGDNEITCEKVEKGILWQ